MKHTQTRKAKIVERRLVLKARCPECGIIRTVKLHDDGVCTILCRCSVDRNSPDGLNGCWIVDPASVMSDIQKTIRVVDVETPTSGH